jgi:hypothetical protein
MRRGLEEKISLMRTRSTLIAGLLLVIVYSLLHAWWVEEHPPIRNDDHFNTEVVLSQHANPHLYPRDLAWSNSEFASNHGFLFIALLQLGEIIFGSYRAAWAGFTLLFLLIYIPGFYGFIYEITAPDSERNGIRVRRAAPLQSIEHIDLKRHWLALILAIGSTMPIYLYVTFANWGITSVYAHVFVTSLCGWIFWGTVKLLRNTFYLTPTRGKRVQWRGTYPPASDSPSLLERGPGGEVIWGLFGLLVSLTIYLNPVNGGGLVGILCAVLLVEALGKRLPWRHWGTFLGGALLGMVPYVVNYAQALAPSITPTQTQIDAAQDIMLNYYANRLYPWVLNERLAPIYLGLVVLTALITLVFFSRREPPRPWTMFFVAVQLGLGYLLIGHPVFLLAVGYWWFRLEAGKVDRWDRLMLVMVTVVNLIAPVTSAISQYLWVERDINLFFTLMFETIRLETYTMLPVYVFIARWIAELIQENPVKGGLLNWIAAVCMLGTIFSIFGANNLVKDDFILMKTYLPIRWGLPIFALGLVWLKRLSRSESIEFGAVLGLSLFAIGFIPAMRPLNWLTIQGWLILGIFLVGLILALSPVSRKHWFQSLPLVIGMVSMVLFPIAGYHKDKPDRNWCDLPNLTKCVDSQDVIAAAEWVQQETPLEAYLFVIGLQPERFQPMAQRSTVHINRSQIYWFQGAAALLDALEIEEQLQGTNPLRADYKGDAYLLAILQDLNADYIVLFGSDYGFDLPIVYENTSVRIYTTHES